MFTLHVRAVKFSIKFIRKTKDVHVKQVHNRKELDKLTKNVTTSRSAIENVKVQL